MPRLDGRKRIGVSNLMEILLYIFILFIIGVAAYFLLSVLVGVGFFAAIGLAFILCLATCLHETEENNNDNNNKPKQEQQTDDTTT
jgi:membrane protein implicated in regulation of membrane protease activity